MGFWTRCRCSFKRAHAVRGYLIFMSGSGYAESKCDGGIEWTREMEGEKKLDCHSPENCIFIWFVLAVGRTSYPPVFSSDCANQKQFQFFCVRRRIERRPPQREWTGNSLASQMRWCFDFVRKTESSADPRLQTNWTFLVVFNCRHVFPSF